jgi:hypothetical protein
MICAVTRFTDEIGEMFRHIVRYQSTEHVVRQALEWCYDEMGYDAISVNEDSIWVFDPEARWTYLNPMKEAATFMFREEKDALLFKIRWYGVVRE